MVMKCSVCGDEVDKIKTRDKHIVLVKNCTDGHIHVQGDLGERAAIKEMLQSANDELGLNTAYGALDRKEIVFRNRQRIGDTLMFTCGVRDFKRAFPEARVNVVSTAGHIWDYNPYLDRTLIPTDENTVKIGPGFLTNASNRIDWHFANAYRVSIEEALKVHIPQGESRPDIWFTEEEYNAPRVIKQPYWIIVVNGEKGWGCKMYPFERWQEFVNQNPEITFVQAGTREDNPPRLQGSNVLDHVGMTQDGNTGIRDLFKLFLNAEGSIGLVSFHMHLSGALYKPCVVVAGAREPVSFTRYPGHQYLATDGCLPCAVTACWHCDIKACPHLINQVPQCVDIISPDDLTRALRSYYKGGRLKVGEPCEKPKLKNVVKTPEKVPEPPKTDITKYGLQWGGGCSTEKDWEFMSGTIAKYSVKSVLEFGSGLSTLLMHDAGLALTTYETEQAWIDKLLKIEPALTINLWDRKELTPQRFDMAFVDGPAGGQSRELSTKTGVESADVVIIHDANREYERKWQEKYLKGYKGPVKGGNRCHLWVKTPKVSAETPQISTINAPGKQHIKVVCTARGWGGGARPIPPLMKFF